jgi:hypothetical protein
MKTILIPLLLIISLSSIAGEKENKQLERYLKSNQGWSMVVDVIFNTSEIVFPDITPRKDTINCLGFYSEHDGETIGTCLIEVGVMGESIDFIYSLNIEIEDGQKKITAKYLTMYHID